jgi:large subunit ribosomal protein L13e
MVKHNNEVHNRHFHKKWQNSSRGPLHVKVNFDQASKKKSRRLKRAAKAAAMAPMPVDKLRPEVHCPTQRYNAKTRLGRGFTLQELKSVKITPAYARSVGIAVDHRRSNSCEESLKLNVERLQNYLNKLTVFPRRKAAKAMEGVETVQLTNEVTGKRSSAVVVEDVPAAGKVSQVTVNRLALKENKILGQRIAAENRKKE